MAQTASQSRGNNRLMQYARCRSLLLSSGSVSAAALALILAPLPVHAQDSAISAVEGTGSVTSGSATIVQTSTQDTVTVNSREAIIDWDLTDDAIGGGDILFLPENNTLQFNGIGDYTVLNRIVPTDATRGIRIDGTVQSFDGQGLQAGNIWFYSPGGIIAGSTSVFDVGGLVLTTNNIDTTGGLFGPGGEIRFRGAAGSTSAVIIENGAQITAPNNGGIDTPIGSSYMALVAPRVVQGGNVNVNGSVAYVGAEQADITINNGLFDINVTVGTSDANGVVHESTGRTLGPSSTPEPGNADAQAVYMVAVPKNDAITMLVSGNIGYFQAASADIVNGEVILSAGYNVSVGGSAVNPAIDIATDPVNTLPANIEFGSITLNASTTVQASDAINMVTEGAQVIAVNNDRYDLTVLAGSRIDIGGRAGGSFRAGRDVTLRAGSSAQGGTINMLVDRNTGSSDALGVFQVDGDLVVDTGGRAAGDININVSQGGRFTIGGNAFLLADAQGGLLDGTATGGDITVNLSGIGSDISFGGITIFDTQARGGIAGGGTGGDVIFNLQDGNFSANDLNISTSGVGGTSGGVAPLAVSFMALAGDMSAGDGADGTGGDVIFNLDLGAGSASVTNLNISANGIGGDGAQGSVFAGTFGGNGGDGIGGNATFNAISGTLNVSNTLTVSANGNSQFSGGRGGFGSGSDGGNGGNGIGGNATFNLNGTATINATTVLVSADGFGGAAGGSGTAFDPQTQAQFPEGNGGIGGAGTGGDAVFNNIAGTLNFQQLTVQSNGIGGQGGDSFGQSTGESTGDGGDGGDGVAGNATINLNQDESGNPQYSVIANGIGGNGGSGLNSGNGGNAAGGVAALNINNVNAQLAPPVISATAIGGDGGFGDGIGGISGDGGSAQGGTARLEASGALAAIDLTAVTVDSDAVGGNGGDGADDFTFAGIGGQGGDGGEATGGISEIVARTGGTITLPPDSFTFTSTGVGGDGGNGGYTYIGTPGDGGDGANGTGGTARFLAQGGTINGNNVIITTSGQGGAAGQGGVYGYYFGGADGAAGLSGFGSGGLSVIEVQEGSPGIINFGATTIESSGSGGGAGGRIEITDTSVDPAGLITFDSLNATVIGLNNPGLTGFYMFSDSGAIAVNGDATVDVSGNIEFDFVNDGRFDVSGNIDLMSGADILVGHTSNSGVDSITSGGTFDAVAQGNFNSMPGSFIVAGGAATVRAEQTATVDDIAGVNLVDISAREDVNLNNGAVTGAAVAINIGAGSIVLGPQLIVQAGLDNGTPAPPPAPPPVPQFDPNFNATITGDVTSTGNIVVNAGGNAVFVGGSNTISDNGLTVQTGDGIIIEAGALVEAAAAPSTSPTPGNPFFNFNNLVLQAGGLTPLSTAILTPISSIVAAGDINANDFAVVMSANAVDGLGGTIAADSLAVDINDAPANGIVQSDDNGLLSAQCVQGNVCLGTLDVSNQLFVGQASNNDVIQAVLEGGSVNADIVRITTRRDLIVGTDGVASTFNGSTEVLLESLEGNIDLRDAALTSDLLQLSAASGSLLGSGDLASTNDIGVTIGADLSANSIDTGGQLTTVADIGGANEITYTVPGSINVGTYTQGAVTAFGVDAGADISFDAINLPADQDIILTAATGGVGDVFLGSATGAQDIDLTGDNVGFGDLIASRDINLLANNGDVTGGNIDAGRLVDIDGQNVAIGDLMAGNITNIDASAGNIVTGNVNVAATASFDATGDITTGDVSASGFGFSAIAGGNISTGAVDTTIGGGVRDIVLRAGGTVDFISIDSNRLVDIDGTSIIGGDINAGATIDALGTDISLGDVTSANGFVTLEATNGNLDAGVLVSDSFSVNVTASGDVGFTSADAAAGVGVNAGGDATFGNAGAGSSMTIDVAGNLVAGNLSAAAASPGMDIIVGGDADIASATSNGLLDIDVGGALTGGDLEGASLTTVNAQSVDVASVSSTGNAVRVFTSSGDAVLGAVSAATGVIVTANGAADIGTATSGGNTNVTGSSVTLDNGTIGNNLTVNATAGDIAGTGTINVAGGIDLDATGNVGFGDLDAQGGDFTVDAGGDVSFASATGNNNVIMNAVGAIDGGDITAAGSATLDAADIAVGNVNADMIDFNSGADILFDGLTSPNAITLTAASGVIGANTGNGDIDSGGDVDIVAQVINVGDVTSGGSVSADASAGDATFGIVGAANDITVSATGTPTLANAISGGNTDITGASVTLNNGAIGGDLTLNATAGDVDANGAITVAGGIDLDATGNIGFGTLGAEGGDFTADAGGNIDFTQANGAANIDMTAGGDVTFDGIDAATGAGIDAGGLVEGDVLSSGGGASVSGENGITIDTLSANGDVELLANSGAIAIAGDLTTPGTVRAIGEDVLVNSSGDLEFTDTSASNGDVAITALGNLLMDETDASSDVNLAAGGSITLGQTEAGDRTSSTGSAGTGNILLDAGTDIILNSDTLAAGQLSANAGGNVQVEALASGETVNISSADIAIASGAQLGEGDFTTDIQLSNTGTDPMFVGGADTTDGYSLSNDEFGNVRSGGDITLRSDAASRQGDDLIIRDLTASAGQGGNIGADGALFFSGGDNTRIEGAVSLGNASADNGIFVDAAQGIAANAETATVELTDASGGFTSEIGMTAPTITALTDSAAADIAGLDTAGIDERLGQNDGVDNPDGIFRADAITFNVTDQLLIQNTALGTDFDDRRGYTVGSGSLQINVDGSDVPIVINGVATDAAGNQVTGIAVIAETGIATTSTGSSFDQASTINGCLIVDPSSCAPVVPPGTGDNPDTPNDRDVIEEGLDPDSSGDPGSFFLSPLIELKDFEEFGYEPLIDEPVTGAGNDDLWLPPVQCERENEEGECVGEQ